MKTQTRFLLSLATLAMACAGSSDAPDVGADAAADLAGETSPDAVAHGPRIVFDSTDFDAGPVAFGVVVTHAWTFRNAGDAVLTLTVPLPAVEALEGC